METSIEKWVRVSGFEGYYSVSSLGRIMSHARITPRNIKMKEEIKAQEDGGNGYLKVQLCRDGYRKKFWVHRLVASHFLPNPMNKGQVNHIDSDPKNNQVTNLEWATPSENMRHVVRSGRSNIQRIAPISWNNRRKGIIQFDLLGNPVRQWDSITDAARFFGTRAGDICSALKGKQKTSRGFKWQYA